MAQDRIYISEPAEQFYEFAISQTDTFSAIGPWQTGPTEDDKRSFESLPDGTPFEVGKQYVFFARDEDPANVPPRGYNYLITVTFARDGQSTATVDLQGATDNGRFTTNKINANGYQAPEFPMVTEATVLMTTRKVLVTRPNGQQVLEEEIVSIQVDDAVSGPAPVAPVIEDQTFIVGTYKEFQFPEFTGAVNYSVSSLIGGVTVIDPSPTGRLIGGTATEASAGKEVTITGYSATGKPASVTFTLRAIQAESRYIREYFGKPTPEDGARFYLFGNGGEPGIRFRLLQGANPLIDSLWNKDPGKWAANELFPNFADYTYLVPTLAAGIYTVEAQLTSSSTVYSEEYVHVLGGPGKKIFPSTVNLIYKKPNNVAASGGVSPTGANDGDTDTDVLIAGGTLSAW
ncbi:hypothetical protein, partial [Larkinella ripae]